MTVANTTVLELLGKQVSFTYDFGDFSFGYSGKITDVVVSLDGNNQISLDEGDFYVLSELKNFNLM